MWMEENWAEVLFSDEGRFHLCSELNSGVKTEPESV